MSSTNACLISIIHHLRGGKGHVLPYHISLSQVSQKLGLEHIFLLSNEDRRFFKSYSNNNKFLAPHRSLELEKEGMLRLVKSWRILYLMLDILKLSIHFRAAFSRINSTYSNKTVFYESFNPFQLLALFLSFIFFPNKKQWQVILLLRGSDKWGNGLYWLQSSGFHFCFKAILKFNSLFGVIPNVQLTSDSEKVAVRLREYYLSDVVVLPIPHTPEGVAETEGLKASITKLWWPGHPRLDKGSEVISDLIKLKNKKLQNYLLHYSSTDLVTAQPADIQVNELSPDLDANEYNELFSKMDVILLPYSKDVYNEATSGVFVECIFAQRPALVPRDTWMAYEYNKFGIPELVFDGTAENLASCLPHASAKSTLLKLRDMSHSYQEFHSVGGFSKVMHERFLKLNKI